MAGRMPAGMVTVTLSKGLLAASQRLHKLLSTVDTGDPSLTSG